MSCKKDDYSRRMISQFFRPLMLVGLPLMKNVLTLLAKSLLILLGLTTATSATDETTQKKIYGSGATALIILNKEIDDIMKIVKSLKKLILLIKSISETIKNETKIIKRRISWYGIRYISC